MNEFYLRYEVREEAAAEEASLSNYFTPNKWVRVKIVVSGVVTGDPRHNDLNTMTHVLCTSLLPQRQSRGQWSMVCFAECSR